MDRLRCPARKRRRCGVSLMLVVILLMVAPVPGLAGSGADPVAEAAEQFLRVLEAINSYYPGEVDVKGLVETAIGAMVNALGDPYSAHLKPEAYQELLQELEGTFSGVGLNIAARDGYVTVISPVPGAPAERSGVMAGDRIVAVDGAMVTGLSVETVAAMIRGREGTAVTLTILRPATGLILNFRMVREPVRVRTVAAEVRSGDIGYVRISMFNERTAEEFRQALRELRDGGARGFVVDLRHNPGGLLEAAVEVAEELVPPGPVARVVRKGGETDLLFSRTPALSEPLVVLVNGGTASGAELVAAAVKAYRTGMVVGTTTMGKGTVQAIIDLGEYGGLRLTTAAYETPDGSSLHGRGLVPDRVVSDMPPVTGIPPGDDSPASWLIPAGPLTRGMTGQGVLALQKALNFLGYRAGPEDGIFGIRTAEAVRRAQGDRGLPPTGEVDALTLAMINGLLYERTARRAEPPAGASGQDAVWDTAADIIRQRLSAN